MKNKQNNKYGFTLVELLAVIVILAIILVIAVPQIMNVIKDTTKASFESSAKMVAAQVENQYTVAQTLNKTFESTGSCMQTWAGLNNTDYESCTYEVTNNGTAKITLVGKGKFKGLKVEEGTRNVATAIEGDSEDNTGVAYIQELLAKEATEDNGLFVDDTDDENIRYAGANPNNKVYFNCKDTYDGKSYGSEGYDYDNACETWRIIGIFDVAKAIGGTTEKRIKIVRDAFKDALGNNLEMTWDSSASNINNGYGINQWGEIKDSNGNIIYEGADLMRLLNGYYIGASNSLCRYCNDSNQDVCSNDCSSNIVPLSSTSLGMIDNAVWSTRTVKNTYSGTSKEMYEAERTSEYDVKCAGSCDTVARTLEWEGKIGLIYPSDWGYASDNENCSNIVYGGLESVNCGSNWLGNDKIWMLSRSEYRYYVWYSSSGYVRDADASYAYYSNVRPTLYLKHDVQIIDGNGGSIPFKLAI